MTKFNLEIEGDLSSPQLLAKGLEDASEGENILRLLTHITSCEMFEGNSYASVEASWYRKEA